MSGADRIGGVTGAAFDVAPFTSADVPEVFALWRACEGIGLFGETEAMVCDCLARSPGLSFVARREGRIVGAVLCTSDGRRGYLHHLAVAADARRLGIGRALALRGLEVMRAQGLPKCHLFVLRDNPGGFEFWKQLGWVERDDLTMMSATLVREP